MNKKEVQKRVLQNGEPISLDKFEWDEKTKTFSTNEDGLVLDFMGVNYCIFKTGYDCTFKTGYDCTFNTGYDCTFKTGYDCTFKTGSYCVVVRRDVYEVIEIPDKKIKLNGSGIKRYTVIDDDLVEITVEGKTKKISRLSAKELNLID